MKIRLVMVEQNLVFIGILVCILLEQIICTSVILVPTMVTTHPDNLVIPFDDISVKVEI